MARSPRYLVGIDLGTTHTVAAYAALVAGAQPRPELFPIEQAVAPGEVAARPLLPSARYHAALDELSERDLALPWPPTESPPITARWWANWPAGSGPRAAAG